MLSPSSVCQTHPGKRPFLTFGLQVPNILFMSVVPFQRKLCSAKTKHQIIEAANLMLKKDLYWCTKQ